MRNALHYAGNATLIVAAFAALAVQGGTHDAPAAGYAHMSPSEAVTYARVLESKPVNVPTFATHGQPGCAPVDGEPAATVLVVTQSGESVRMNFDTAWNRGHDSERANDVWVVGVCR